MTRMSSRRRETALLLGVLVLQVLAPHTGGGEVSAAEGGVATLAAIGQTALLLGRRRRPLEVAVGVVLLYAVQVAAVDVVPPVAAWVALTALATAPRPHVERVTAAVTAALVLVIAVGEAAHPRT